LHTDVLCPFRFRSRDAARDRPPEPARKRLLRGIAAEPARSLFNQPDATPTGVHRRRPLSGAASQNGALFFSPFNISTALRLDPAIERINMALAAA
jgi:hypothetical protein